jgi:hypothetical protein
VYFWIKEPHFSQQIRYLSAQALCFQDVLPPIQWRLAWYARPMWANRDAALAPDFSQSIADNFSTDDSVFIMLVNYSFLFNRMILIVELITCFTVIRVSITIWRHSKPYFSFFHLVVVIDDDVNMRLFKKRCMRRRLLLLKSIFLSHQIKIIECFISSILHIQHSLFVIKCERINH